MRLASLRKISGRKNCKETLFSLENGIYKNRPVSTLYICTARVGNADPSVASSDSSPFRGACDTPMPSLKGEVPAVGAVGFKRRPWPLQSMAANGRR